MQRNKICFHFGSDANAIGYGDYIRACDEAGIPAGCMSMFGEGLGDIFALWDAGSTVEHTAVVRYMPDSGQDVPPYGADQAQAAIDWWAWQKPKIGVDVRRYSPRVVIKMGNELDKNQAEWLAGFYLALYDIMQNDPDGPFRLAAFNWSSGEPEPEHWRGPKMLEYLRLCADDPIGAAIGLHEYSYADELEPSYPFLIGRFEELFKACDENNIARPNVYIHEWGWRQDTMPDVPTAMQQIPWAAALYAQHPEIKAAGMWTLQDSTSYGNINLKVQPMIEPITNYTLTVEFPDPPPIIPPTGGTMIIENVRTVPRDAIISFLAEQKNVTLKVYERVYDNGHTVLREHVIPIGDDAMNLYFRTEGTETDTIEVECEENPNPPIAQIAQGAIGHDVSAWQGSFDWSGAVANGVEYGIIRCADGMTASTSTHDANGIDREFWGNAQKLHDIGIPWSIYHFLRPGSIQAQADKVLGALADLTVGNTQTRTAVFDNGVLFPSVWIDVEDGNLSNQNILDFYNLLSTSHHVGIYSGKGIWESITGSVAVWWADVPLWIAAYGTNDGTLPNWPNGPNLPRGWDAAQIWQYTSIPLDTNSAGPYAPTPPTQASYSTAFMRGEPGIWRVIRRSDGSGEDVWELPLDVDNDVRVKNTSQGEWYGYLSDGVYRTLDTSPANDSQGNERYYTLSQNGQLGGQIAPAVAIVGVTYTFNNDVQFYKKDVGAGCPPLAENSGTNVGSTFTLVEVIDNHTFSTGLTVDRLYVTVQTGETQLYAEHDGRIIGWCGGGASQDNNVWGGELAELHFGRVIPGGEPNKYCV